MLAEVLHVDVCKLYQIRCQSPLGGLGHRISNYFQLVNCLKVRVLQKVVMVFRFIICPNGPGHSCFSNAFWFQSDVLQPLRALLRDARKNYARTQAGKDEPLGNSVECSYFAASLFECFVGSCMCVCACLS